MVRTLALIVGSGVLIACGLVHGQWTDRFQQSAPIKDAVARLDQVPLQLGPNVQGRPEWLGEVLPCKAGQAGAGVAGCLQVQYVNQQTGKAVVVSLVCGRPGPVSIHSPDACYVANGYDIDRPHKVGSTEAEFWQTDAVLKNVTEEKRSRIYWAWNNGQGWKANADPRQEYVRSPVLYKLYVVRVLEGQDDKTAGEPCQRLIEVLLPELNKALFAPAE
jgi:hypothetical protein